jgi:hypothetical protein
LELFARKEQNMPISDQVSWDKWVAANTDAYGGACINVAREAMRLLDERPEPITDTHKLICDADDAAKTGGITGFMAGCVAQMIAKCHSRGEEFRRAWNGENQLGDEGDRANDKGTILNPAVLCVGKKQ